MIGVISKSDQRESVEEFFQLFKTPWEFYRPGTIYAVVIATVPDVPAVNTSLLLLFGSASNSFDSELGITSGRLLNSPIVTFEDTSIPAYSDVLTFAESAAGTVVMTAGTETVGLSIRRFGSTIIRLGYDLFEEVERLLTTGQPVEHAKIPTLDAHIGMLRSWILGEGIPLIEIPPVPAGYPFAACLTHDIDFIGIRNHRFDHTMWGFLYRSSIGSVSKLLRGRITLGRLLESWRAAALLPLVYLGWVKDFWEPFGWYLKVEQNLPVTYFLIPFKHQTGDRVSGPDASRRASAYDVTDLRDWPGILQKEGCELGVHGLDAWHDADKGRAELERIRLLADHSEIGVRVHWLLQDEKTFETLDSAGFDYDSTAGFNGTIGYRNGTTQVFRPIGVRTLLELPMHIQDGALFFPGRLDLSDSQAEELCQPVFEHAVKTGGVLTLLWHDRSHGPERYWGEFYLQLLEKLKLLNAWFASGRQVVAWFRKRRGICFERIGTGDGVHAQVRYSSVPVEPPFRVRIYRPARGCRNTRSSDFVDISWSGEPLDLPEKETASSFGVAVTNRAL